ncbi:MAG: DUF4159 domain-containing protein [Phycisphaerae bacterium]
MSKTDAYTVRLKWPAFFCVTVAMLAAPCADAQGGSDAGATLAGLSTADLDTAIDRGIRFLESMQRPEGRWLSQELESTYPNATTALVAYTLLKAGIKPTNWRLTRVAKAFKDRSKTRTALARACTLLMWCALDPHQYWREIDEDVKYLTRIQSASGGWGEPQTAGKEKNAAPIVVDPVVSHLALLAMADAVHTGQRANPRLWLREEHAATQFANADGDWPYFGGRNPSSMPTNGCATAARLASLYPTYDIRHLNSQLKFNGRFMAKCGVPNKAIDPIRQAIDGAWRWLDEHFQTDHVPGEQAPSDGRTRLDSLPFFLYAVSQAEVFGGRTRIAGAHAPTAIARRLIDMQQMDGSWGAIHDTCFALLALRNAQRPLAFSKAVFEESLVWHRRPRDVANLTRWLSKERTEPLAWQAVDMAQRPDALMAAPLLLISEHDLPNINDKTGEAIQRFVHGGGTILAMPCCSRVEFTESFQAMTAKWFPRFRQTVLSADHPMWRMGDDVALGKPAVGYGDACRTSIFLLDAPVACAWQQDLAATYPQFFQVARNIYAYATFHRKPAGWIKPFVKPTDRRIPAHGGLKIARLRHGGDWWIKPAWLSRVGPLVGGLNIAELPPVDAQDARRSGADILWLTGSTFEPVRANGRAELKAFLAAGGTLIATACCGSEAFDRTFQEFMMGMYGEDRWERVPSDDSLMTGAFTAPASASLEGVSFAARFETPPPPRPQWPLLLGVKRGTRWIVLYCPYDVTSAALEESCPTCVGYARDDARRIVKRMLRYAAKPKTPAEPPTP